MTATEARCGLTELIATQCAHCLGHDLEVKVEPVITSRFQARYAGRCANCAELFAEGDWVCRTDQASYVCNSCGNWLGGVP
jgi:hypothetical protein